MKNLHQLKIDIDIPEFNIENDYSINHKQNEINQKYDSLFEDINNKIQQSPSITIIYQCLHIIPYTSIFINIYLFYLQKCDS